MEKECLNCCKLITKIKPSHFERKKFCSRACRGEYTTKNKEELFAHMRTSKTLKCDYCSKEFRRKLSIIGERNYCCKECAYSDVKNVKHKFTHLKERVTISCNTCGKKFEVKNSRGSTAKFCSRECLGHANGLRNTVVLSKKKEVNCHYCGKSFMKKQCVIKERNYCTVDCMGKDYSESGLFSGENSGTWLGGEVDYYGPNWRHQRRKARERDGYVCKDCGISEEDYGIELSIHHKKLFRDFQGDWKKANHLSNLVSLCEPCHRIRHSNNYETSVNDIV